MTLAKTCTVQLFTQSKLIEYRNSPRIYAIECNGLQRVIQHARLRFPRAFRWFLTRLDTRS